MKPRSPLHYSPLNGSWSFDIGGGHKGRGYLTKEECAKAYAKALVTRSPKYKDLLKDKPWPEVFRILGIEI